MNVCEFIDSCVTRKQLPYVRLITVYITDGIVTGVCLCRYADKKIAKKASKVGIIEDRMMIDKGKGTTIMNFNGYNIQKGSYYLNYCTNNHDLSIYKQ